MKMNLANSLFYKVCDDRSRCLADTMMKFASFETIVEMLYKHAIPTPKDQCSKPFQLGVSFAGGYAAGILCAAVSHPADNLVSFLNNAKGATVGDVREFFAQNIMVMCA